MNNFWNYQRCNTTLIENKRVDRSCNISIHDILISNNEPIETLRDYYKHATQRIPWKKVLVDISFCPLELTEGNITEYAKECVSQLLAFHSGQTKDITSKRL